MIIRTLVTLACAWSPERGAYVADCVPIVSPIAAPTTCEKRREEIKAIMPANIRLVGHECMAVWRE